jgi:YkoY family integral membrane protein
MFATEDLLVIGTLVLLEGLLSADNALVLAVLVKHLPPKQRQKALLYGIGGAFVFRFIGLLAASFIIRSWYLRALGAVYLAYLAIKHFATHTSRQHGVRPKAGFWRTVIAVETTDVAFAIDSIMVAVALSKKLWVVYIGAVLGIIAMRLAAGAFIKLLERYPALEDTAYAMVAWVSVKLFVETYEAMSESLFHLRHAGHLLPPFAFWIGMGLIFLFGSIIAFRKKKKSRDSESS